MRSFEHSSVVITGGATGIGFALAKAFGKEGACVMIAEPRQHRLEEAVASLREEGINAVWRTCDVTQSEEIEALADSAWSEFGAVDVLINNAGIKAPNQPVTELDIKDLHAVFDVNFFGMWRGAAIFGKRMIEQGRRASLYSVGSELSFFSSVPNATAYMASKHAVLGMVEGLREEMPDFIDVGLIVPGFVGTEMHAKPVASLGMSADQFAEVVMPQIKSGERFAVSHAFNIEHITERFESVSKAYETYAPRYEGDDEFDVKAMMARRKSN